MRPQQGCPMKSSKISIRMIVCHSHVHVTIIVGNYRNQTLQLVLFLCAKNQEGKWLMLVKYVERNSSINQAYSNTWKITVTKLPLSVNCVALN